MKKTFIKAFGLTSFVLLIGFAEIMAFVPLTTTKAEIQMKTMHRLISPKLDDPIIYTTESGLDSKWGNAAPDTASSSLSSGNLAGFPYFTTTSGSTTYTWVIIGRNSNVTSLNTAVQSYLFSTWKTHNPSNDWKFGNSFFSSIYETSSPAGNLIDSTITTKTYVMDNKTFSISGVVSNSEIPSNNVLVLANDNIETTLWSSHYAIEHLFNNENNVIRQKCVNYYDSDTFGFKNYLTKISEVTLTQYGAYHPKGYNALRVGQTTTDLHFFPLGTNADYDNFRWQSYLTTSQVGASSGFWGRSQDTGDAYWYNVYVTNTDGSISLGRTDIVSGYYTYNGLRPAFCLDIC